MASSSRSHTSSKLPLKPIPGDCGLRFFGAISDRHDYFYRQGRDKFFSSRIRKYNSTVFRTNMPPGPFISSDPRVVAVLDAISFQILLDNSKVEKRNVLDGTFMPSTAFTGGYRVCAFLDTSEPSHALLKSFYLHLLASRHDSFIPLFSGCLSELFHELEDKFSEKGQVSFNTFNDKMSFDFVFRLLCGPNSDPKNTILGSNGPKLFQKWLAVQLAPLGTLGLPKIFDYLEDFLLRTLPFPAWIVKSDYKKLFDVFSTAASATLDEAERFGLKRDEACHNLIFMAGFNAYGGLKSQFPILMKWVGSAGGSLHKELADEIRTVVKAEGGITFAALEKMTLTKSVVYEVLRIEPAVPYQYAKAREDLVIQSHDAAFEIKKGEMIFGYQPLATKDPLVFVNPEVFVGHRFVGEGEKLLKYVYWSNARETEEPSKDDKQCPAKNLVVLLCRVMLVEFFLRYDTFTVEIGKSSSNLGASVTFTSLIKSSR
ncbi:allene oxide synthase 3-like [Prosopis cineraria]|uniref:allene oxide synthase 3-like n=1 Tax=Prosopis cineraria TaxID=364024 RepID=UPI0024102CC9|nr:allene oxide synthase 3-like [Prosopis cineraria]